MTQVQRLAIAIFCWIASTFGQAVAGEFAVNPVRLELGPNARSAAVSVFNEGAEKLSFQLQASDWTQDAEGKDVYTDSRDLVFFPKIMSVEPGQEGIVRVGLKGGASLSERTFRLFIEELPGVVKKPQGNGAQITFLVRFGLPIFVAPLQAQDGLAIEAFDVRNGAIAMTAKNTGNRHQLYKRVHLVGTDGAGQQIYALDIADRYLLAGTAKSYSASLTAEQCRKIAVLSVEIQTDKLSQVRKLDVSRTMCS